MCAKRKSGLLAICAMPRALPISQLNRLPPEADGIPELDKDRRVYVHCAVGARAQKVAKWMSELGYDSVALVCTLDDLIRAGFEPG